MGIWLSFLFVCSALSPFFCGSVARARGFLLFSFVGNFLFYIDSLKNFFNLPSQPSARVLLEAHSWAPGFGLEFGFRFDGLSALFAGLVSLIGFFIQIYAVFYFKEVKQFRRYLTPMVLFMASMVGVTISDNFFLFFVFWELTSLSSYFLVAFDRENAEARQNARNALLITVLGGVALLAGLVALSIIPGAGSSFSTFGENISAAQTSGLFRVGLVGLLLGAFTKSAQWPFHFWLPGAMAAPAPVSAYLHSATLVKVGIFLILRFTPYFNEIPLWQNSLLVFGGITFLWAVGVALWETGFKKILAYTTLSSLGLCIFLAGLPYESSMAALIVVLVAHAFYKAPLFLAAGTIEKGIKEKDIRFVGRIYQHFPVLSVSIFICSLSMAGFPPFLGFVGKELVLYDFFSINGFNINVISKIIFLLGSILGVAVSFKFAASLIFRRSIVRKDFKPDPILIKKTVPLSWVVLLLGLFSLVLGLFPNLLQPFLNEFLLLGLPTKTRETISISLHLWHGWNPLLLLSLIVLFFGLLVNILQFKISQISLSEKNSFTAVRVFESGLKLILTLGGRLHRLVQSGNMSNYVLAFVVFSILIFSLNPRIFSFFNLSGVKDLPNFYEVVVFSILCVSTIFCTITSSAWASIVVLGVVGYSIALVFGNFGAPDLAMTQICIESLAIVIFVKLLPSMPRFESFTPLPLRSVQIFLSVLAGAGLTFLTYFSLENRKNSLLTEFFNAQSLVAAHGRNVVNVIIVDFRALDTMGEITVLGISALGIAGILGVGWFSLEKFKKGNL